MKIQWKRDPQDWGNDLSDQYEDGLNEHEISALKQITKMKMNTMWGHMQQSGTPFYVQRVATDAYSKYIRDYETYFGEVPFNK